MEAGLLTLAIALPQNFNANGLETAATIAVGVIVVVFLGLTVLQFLGTVLAVFLRLLFSPIGLVFLALTGGIFAWMKFTGRH
ncbi:MAG: hypothetical protein QM692_21825 [Thermomicrobiales bacterium]